MHRSGLREEGDRSHKISSLDRVQTAQNYKIAFFGTVCRGKSPPKLYFFCSACRRKSPPPPSKCHSKQHHRLHPLVMTQGTKRTKAPKLGLPGALLTLLPVHHADYLRPKGGANRNITKNKRRMRRSASILRFTTNWDRSSYCTCSADGLENEKPRFTHFVLCSTGKPQAGEPTH